MKKRMISVILLLALLAGVVPPVYAAEETVITVGKLELYSDYVPTKDKWTAALKDGERILMTPEDIASIAGADLVAEDDGYVLNRNGYCVRVNAEKSCADIFISMGNFGKTPLYQGSFSLDGISKTEYAGKNMILLPLEQMLYLLNVQWICAEGCVYTFPPEDTLWNVMADYSNMLSVLPSRTALAGDTLRQQYGTYFKYAALSFMDEINPLYWVPGISVDDKFEKEALLALAEPCTGSTEQSQQSVSEYLTHYIKDVSGFYGDVSDKMDDTVSVAKLMYDTMSDVKADIPDAVSSVTDGLSYGASAANVVLTATRYMNWTESYVEQLDYLRNITSGADKSYLKLVTRNANSLYKEKDALLKNVATNTAVEAAKQSLDKAAGFTLYGQVMAAYSLILAGMKIIPGFDEALDAGDSFHISMNLYNLTCLMRPRVTKAADFATRNTTEENLNEMRLTATILMNAAAHCWDKYGLAIQQTDDVASIDEAARNMGFCSAMVMRLSESKRYDLSLQLDGTYSNLYSTVSGAHREKIPPEYVTFDPPICISACIGEYGGVIYCTREVPNSNFVVLPVEPAEYDDISSFAFYRGKLYYCCKDAGTSDYRSALYRCNPDGTELEKILGDGELSYTNSFHIIGDDLYPHGSYRYYNIADECLVDSEDYIGDFGAVPEWFNMEYVFYMAANTIAMAKYDPESPYQWTDKQDIAPITTDYMRIAGITSGCMYYETTQGNTASLYQYDIRKGVVSLIDSKPSAGSGWYFNW